jgi:hypothetical protein
LNWDKWHEGCRQIVSERTYSASPHFKPSDLSLECGKPRKLRSDLPSQLTLCVSLIGIVVYVVYSIFESIPYIEYLFLCTMLLTLRLTAKRDKMAEQAIIFFIIGLLWEVCTEPCWTYRTDPFPMIFLYKDVPVAMLFYWVSVFSIASSLFSQIMKKFNLNKLFAHITLVWY